MSWLSFGTDFSNIWLTAAEMLLKLYVCPRLWVAF